MTKAPIKISKKETGTEPILKVKLPKKRAILEKADTKKSIIKSIKPPKTVIKK